MSRRFPLRLTLALALACAATIPMFRIRAQDVRRAPADLQAFEGRYEYRDGATLFVVPDGQRLVAILGDGKYPLRPSGDDTFTNGSGDRIPFLRDPSGRVIAFTERGETFRRLTSDVPPTTRALLTPRPAAPDGTAARYRYAAPPQLNDGLTTGAAGAGSLPVALAEQLVTGVIDGTYADVHAVVVHHKGALRLEEYFYGFDRDRPHQMRSLTKSVVALLAGVAVDRGALEPAAPALGRLGYAAFGHPDPRKARITLFDLLSHRSGLACNDYDGESPGNEVKLYEADDWPKAFVDLPMVADPTTVAHYCSGGIFTAGRVVERATGTALPALAQEALMTPLGIAPGQWRWTFRLDRSQRNEFGQIYLRPRDMLKLGLLIAQRGEWQRRRVVSPAWIAAAVAKQSRIGDSDYGLGIWHRWYQVTRAGATHRVDTIMLSGNGGQKVYVVPSLDAVIVFAGGAFNVESPVNDIMARVLLPALMNDPPTATPAAGQ